MRRFVDCLKQESTEEDVRGLESIPDERHAGGSERTVHLEKFDQTLHESGERTTEDQPVELHHGVPFMQTDDCDFRGGVSSTYGSRIAQGHGLPPVRREYSSRDGRGVEISRKSVLFFVRPETISGGVHVIESLDAQAIRHVYAYFTVLPDAARFQRPRKRTTPNAGVDQ